MALYYTPARTDYNTLDKHQLFIWHIKKAPSWTLYLHINVHLERVDTNVSKSLLRRETDLSYKRKYLSNKLEKLFLSWVPWMIYDKSLWCVYDACWCLQAWMLPSVSGQSNDASSTGHTTVTNFILRWTRLVWVINHGSVWTEHDTTSENHQWSM